MGVGIAYDAVCTFSMLVVAGRAVVRPRLGAGFDQTARDVRRRRDAAGQSSGHAAVLQAARRRHRPGVRQMVGDRAEPKLDDSRPGLQRRRSGRLPGRRLDDLRRDRQRRKGARNPARLHRQRRRAAVGAKRQASPPGSTPRCTRGSRQPPNTACSSVHSERATREATCRPASRRRCRASASGRCGTSRTSARTSAPQATNGSTVLDRALPCTGGSLDAGWSALQATGHGRDTILIGSLAARGQAAAAGPGRPDGLPGNYGMTKPLAFVRSLYCVDSRYRPLTGTAAARVGCPSSPARFRSAHPALFGASGFADHPYPVNLPPTRATSNDPDFTEFSQLPRLESSLDRIQRVYGSGKRFPIYITEYGYVTNPPNHSQHFVSPATAAVYINWAEYLSWRSPRIATTMQYLLNDPNPTVGRPRVRRLRHGAAVLRRQAEADARRLPRPAVPARDLDRPHPRAGGVGLRASGSLRAARLPPGRRRLRFSSSAAHADRLSRSGRSGSPTRAATSTSG